MQVGVITLVEILKKMGFIEGFTHGATRRTIHEILDSNAMDLVLDRVIQTINRGRRNQLTTATITVTKESIKAVAKLALEYPIQLQRLSQSNTSFHTQTIDIVISDRLIAETAGLLSCSNEAAEFVTKTFLQALHDQEMLNKPLYSIGNSVGDYTISFSRGAVNDVFSYEEEEPTCCSNFMNTITCGCWGFFFKRPRVPGDENIIRAIDLERDTNHDHPGLRRRMIN